MPGRIVTKKLTYIQKLDVHSKETKHTSHERAARTSHQKTAHLTKFHSTIQVQWTEYKLQNTEKKQQKNNKRRKQRKRDCGNWTWAVKPVAQHYRLSYPDPISNSLLFTPKFTSPRLTSLHSNSFEFTSSQLISFHFTSLHWFTRMRIFYFPNPFSRYMCFNRVGPYRPFR
jgi:hypothetical protein